MLSFTLKKVKRKKKKKRRISSFPSILFLNLYLLPIFISGKKKIKKNKENQIKKIRTKRNKEKET
jgi:hypothetical protein